jgi:uncharacterized protein DUF6249
MRATAAVLTLTAAVSAMGAAPPAFATGATLVPAPSAAAATPGAATGEGQAATADDAQATPLAARQAGADDSAMPAEMVRKLSPEQIVAILREREMRRATFSGRPADIVGTTIFFGALVTMVLLAQAFATRRERIRQGTLRAMVEKGMEIPPSLIGDRARRSSDDLRRGLVLVGAGLGLSLVFALVHLNGQSGSGLWSVGLVPMLMGGGYLVAWRVEPRNTSDRP